MDPAEAQRTWSVRVWIALLVSVGLYGLLLLRIRSRPPSTTNLAANASLFWTFLALGVVVVAIFWWLTARRLRSGPGTALGRVRALFLLRAVSAEVMMLYGMMIGFMRRPIQEPLVFFAAALAVFALCFPSREAWAEAVRIAENPVS